MTPKSHTYKLTPYTTLFRSKILVKINCQINPKITPPIKLGVKNPILKKFCPLNPLVTNNAKVKAIVLVKIKDQKVYLVVNKRDRKSTRLNSSHVSISYAVFC